MKREMEPLKYDNPWKVLITEKEAPKYLPELKYYLDALENEFDLKEAEGRGQRLSEAVHLALQCLDDIQRIKLTKVIPTKTLNALAHLARPEDAKYFIKPKIIIPWATGVCNPFWMLPKNPDDWPEMIYPIKVSYGENTHVSVLSGAMTAEDEKTFIGMLLLKGIKEAEMRYGYYRYGISLRELAEITHCANPGSVVVHDRIWESIKRIHATSLHIKTKKQRYGSLVHILGDTGEMGRYQDEENSSGEIDITLSRIMVDLYCKQYILLREVYFDLPPKARKLFVFFSPLPQFGKHGKPYEIGIDKLYRITGLGGPYPDKVERYKKIDSITTGLIKLKEKDLIRRYSFSDKNVSVTFQTIPAELLIPISSGSTGQINP